jgi:hypothetical protein
MAAAKPKDAWAQPGAGSGRCFEFLHAIRAIAAFANKNHGNWRKGYQKILSLAKGNR